MKKRVTNSVIIFLCLTASLQAQTNNLDSIKSKIIELTSIEINAFKTGDCETLANLINDNATFYLDGKKAPSKEMIIGFCRRITRPFEKPANVTTNVFPISNTSAYVVRIMEFTKNKKLYKKEIVTKIWAKDKEGWKISHLHSTIKKL